MTIEINNKIMEEFVQFIHNQEFIDYVLYNTSTATGALILQTLFNQADEIKRILEKD